ncbi:hypothetical protein AB0C65_31970 [Nocardia sp. NPDC048505]|uniref:hypothetical protein n=1 Tax=Nocardia sp. NPDC048505 TaxID=3155756 RepID=UPI0033FBCE27
MLVLAEFGWAEMLSDDVRLLVRLIRMKQRIEVAEPIDATDTGDWYALPTTDQAAVLDAFDLIDPIPATLRMGFAVWGGASPVYSVTQEYWPGQRNPLGWPRDCEVFISPALDGWTLVMPRRIYALERFGDQEARYARLRALSRRFGAAHFYRRYEDGVCYESSRCIAENDSIRIHFGCLDDDVDFSHAEEFGGPATLMELRAWLEARSHGRSRPRADPRNEIFRPDLNALRARFGKDPLPTDNPARTPELDPMSEECGMAWAYGAEAAAWHLSVSLEELGPHTRVEGTGVLAIPASDRNYLRRGRLPI